MANEPTLRELYERALERAETEAAMEWRRCFAAEAVELQPRHTVLGSVQDASTNSLPQSNDAPSNRGEIELRDWAPPVVQELSAANQSLGHVQS
ncbi:UNVERIFIED_CONTAM: hypothetical protein Q9R58_25415 [Methylobacteriaceae bacterium AG10]|nr:hypothetical protein [Methylobacteriaceae bacterium AG10]